MIKKMEKVMSNLINGEKKNIFSYLFYALLVVLLGVGVIGKFIFTSLVLNKKRLE